MKILNALPVFLALSLCHAQTDRKSETHGSVPPAQRHDYAYVSLDAEQSIAVYRIDAAKGDLVLVRKIAVSGEPGSLAVDPSHSVLYAAVRSTNSISSYRMDRRNGDLTFINTIHAAGNPVYLATDRTGKFLLSSYFADSKAAIYSIRSDGGVRESAVTVLATAKNAHAVRTDPANRFLFIPCRTGESIHLFRFDQRTGLLTPNTPDCVTTPPPTGPRHLAFHPMLSVAYFVNEFGNSVTAYRLSPAGVLAEFQTISSLPEDFRATSSGADVHLTPDGRFLYASNRGHESIAAFSVDADDGKMTSIGFFATEKTPRSFAIDPAGKFLYAGGQGSGRIASYRIDGQTGSLIPLVTYDVGRNPVWILTVQLNNGQ